MSATRTVLILVTGLSIPSPTLCHTWHIMNDGSGDAPTIQAGIDSAASGDTVLVSPGIYFEHIDFLGKGVAVVGLDGSTTTTLDGSTGNGSVVVFKGGEGRAALLEGFTITGGNGTAWFPPSPNSYGGGISVFNGSPTIRANTISGNQADWGGGIFAGLESSDRQPFPLPQPVLENNRIENNIGNFGAGGAFIRDSIISFQWNVFQGNRTLQGDGAGLRIILNEGSSVIKNNTFAGNIADDQGGAVHVAMSAVLGPVGPVTIDRNLFVHNEALGRDSGDVGAGGAICAASLFGAITNNTIVYNIGLTESICGGGGIRLWDSSPHSASDLMIKDNIIAFNSNCGIACWFGATATFGNNLMWSNDGGDIGENSADCPATWAQSIIGRDPYFCDPASDNFTVAANSPAITGPEIMGAFPNPGCGPVSTHVATWGRLKALYKK